MTESVNTSKGSVSVSTELEVDIQYALKDCDSADSDAEEPPSPETLTRWATTAFRAVGHGRYSSELTIRIVGGAEMRELNYKFRGKDKTTNVLSFSFEPQFDIVSEMSVNLLGDVVICHSVVVAEAKHQAKAIQDHYAHMVTHGVLHLCGYDHQTEQEAGQMEAIEVTILSQSNIANPYVSYSDLN